MENLIGRMIECSQFMDIWGGKIVAEIDQQTYMEIKESPENVYYLLGNMTQKPYTVENGQKNFCFNVGRIYCAVATMNGLVERVGTLDGSQFPNFP